MAFLRTLRDRLIALEVGLAAASLLALLVLALAQILMRNLFDSGIAGADVLTRHLVLYVTFFGAALAVDRDRHIKIDVCCTFLSLAALRRLYRPLRAIAALVCAFFADAAIRFWRDEWAYAPGHEQWQVLIALVIPVGFVLLSLQFALAALLGQDEDSCCPR